jgi:hypothetical protein
MRIEFSDPVAGLLMTLPLIAILMTAGRSAIVLTQRPGQESGRTTSANPQARACDTYREVYDIGSVIPPSDEGYRSAMRYVRTGQRWRNRPEATADCEVFVSCQQMRVMRER